MTLHRSLPLIGLALLGTACTVRTYEYRERPTTYVATCDPSYPCANTYYWDEWRGVYVFYDGYRYYDALGTPRLALALLAVTQAVCHQAILTAPPSSTVTVLCWRRSRMHSWATSPPGPR